MQFQRQIANYFLQFSFGINSLKQHMIQYLLNIKSNQLQQIQFLQKIFTSILLIFSIVMGILRKLEAIHKKNSNQFKYKHQKFKTISKQNSIKSKQSKDDINYYFKFQQPQQKFQTQIKLQTSPQFSLQPLRQSTWINKKKIIKVCPNEIGQVQLFKDKIRREKHKKKIQKKLQHQSTQQSDSQLQKEQEDDVTILPYQTSQCLQKLFDNLVIIQDLCSSQDQYQQFQWTQQRQQNQYVREQTNIDQIKNKSDDMQIAKKQYFNCRKRQFSQRNQCQNQLANQGRKIKNCI